MGISYDDGGERVQLNEGPYIEALSKNLKERLDQIPEEPFFYHASGLMGKKKIEPKPIFNEVECETVYEGQNNSYIVLGRDRPGEAGSGYGGIGAGGASAIDLVVGRSGRNARRVDKKDKTLKVDNDFVADSARIYISERTDIDLNFGLVPGKIGNPRGRSGIGIKADNVRIMAREGIKLVTRPDEKNSMGGRMDVILGVDIIAGDDDSDLQPMVKGENLAQLLKYMVDDSRRLAQMIHSLTLGQAALESMLACHTHTTGGAAGPGVAIPSIELGIYTINSQIKRIVSDIPSQIVQTFNNISEEIEFLNPYGARYINSKANHVN
tara:strand:- start:1241 stop:2212 length:972 start_codon:yes stop_codon:yes gene_type:complete